MFIMIHRILSRYPDAQVLMAAGFGKHYPRVSKQPGLEPAQQTDALEHTLCDTASHKSRSHFLDCPRAVLLVPKGPCTSAKP